MLPAILVIAGLFLLLLIPRFGGMYRKHLLARWPAVALAGAAIITLSRGGIWPGLLLAAAAAAAWVLWPSLRRPAPPPPASDTREDAEARTILGLGPQATEAEIRAAYRTKMRQAHPDRGGKHSEAARLTAARDRLLRRR